MSSNYPLVTPRGSKAMSSLPREIDTDSKVTVAINSKETILASDHSGFLSIDNEHIVMARKLSGNKLLIKYRGTVLDDGSRSLDSLTFSMTNEQEVDEIVIKLTRALVELRVIKKKRH